ncbi:MAG: universal stress protein [Chloroflexota bacterium]
MFRKILVGLDGSKLAEQILPYVTAEAEKHGSTVLLLQVVTSQPVMMLPGVPGMAGGPVSTQTLVDQLDREEKQARTYLRQMAQKLRRKGLKVKTVLLQGAPPGEAIVKYAAEKKVGLIAIATHGRGGLGRLFYGSVADHILKHSAIPVLVVRPRETA